MQSFKEFFDESLLLEAKDPQAYVEELFGSFFDLFEVYKEDLHFSPQFEHYLENTKNIIESSFGYLRSSDRINFFAPFFMFALLNKTSGYVDVINPKTEFTKKLKRIDNNNQKKIDVGSQTNMSINNMADTIKHYFRDQANIQTIQAYTFGNKPRNYNDRIGDLELLENKFNEKAGKVLDPAQDDPEGTELITKLVDSKKVYFEWVNLNTENCPTKEAQLMNHCGSSDKADTMFSLRRAFNKQELTNLGITQKEGRLLRKPVITFAMEYDGDSYILVESHGISNSKPQVEFHEAIVALFETKIISGINQRGAYSKGTTFKLDDLSPELRARVEEANPDLEEEAAPIFEEEEIKRAEQLIENVDLPEGVAVYMDEDSDAYADDDYTDKYGIPYRIDWGYEIDMSQFNLDTSTLEWDNIKSKLNIHDNTEWGSGGDSEDVDILSVRLHEPITAYPSEDNLYVTVNGAIDDARGSYETFIEDILPLIITNYGPETSSEIEEYFENFKEIKDDLDVEVGITPDGLIYKHEITTNLNTVEMPQKSTLVNWIRKWNKDDILDKTLPKSRNKNDFDPNQMEFEFPERQMVEEHSSFDSVINILLEAIRKPNGRSWVIKTNTAGNKLIFVCYLNMDLNDIDATSYTINQIHFVNENKEGFASDLLDIIKTPELGKTTMRQAREKR